VFGHHHTQTNTDNVNKIWTLLQTNGGMIRYQMPKGQLN
jgi:hypothetical protein